MDMGNWTCDMNEVYIYTYHICIYIYIFDQVLQVKRQLNQRVLNKNRNMR